MGITQIAVCSAAKTLVLPADGPACAVSAPKGLTLRVDCDGGAVSVFVFGRSANGRVGDRWQAPYDFVLPDLLPGEQKLVVEQYKLGRLVERSVRRIVISPIQPHPAMRIGIVDLMRRDHTLVADHIAPLHITDSREWIDTSNFGTYRPRNLARHAAYSAAGIAPTFCFAQSGLTPAIVSAGDVAAWTAAAITDLRRQLGGAAFRIELGNEINLLDSDGRGHYWNVPAWDRDQRIDVYIQRVQAPMYRAIKAIDPTIECIAPAFSWDCAALETHADALLEYADVLAFHPYPNGITTIALERVARSVEVAHRRRRRIAFTEAQLNYGKSLRDGRVTINQWGRDLETFIMHCAAAGVDEFHYFVAYDAGTTNSPGALFTSSGGATPMYHAFKRSLATLRAMP